MVVWVVDWVFVVLVVQVGFECGCLIFMFVVQFEVVVLVFGGEVVVVQCVLYGVVWFVVVFVVGEVVGFGQFVDVGEQVEVFFVSEFEFVYVGGVDEVVVGGQLQQGVMGGGVVIVVIVCVYGVGGQFVGVEQGVGECGFVGV